MCCYLVLFSADDEMQFDPNSFMQTMQKMFGEYWVITDVLIGGLLQLMQLSVGIVLTYCKCSLGGNTVLPTADQSLRQWHFHAVWSSVEWQRIYTKLAIAETILILNSLTEFWW